MSILVNVKSRFLHAIIFKKGFLLILTNFKKTKEHEFVHMAFHFRLDQTKATAFFVGCGLTFENDPESSGSGFNVGAAEF